MKGRYHLGNNKILIFGSVFWILMQCSDLILGNLQPNTIQPSSLQSYT